MPLWVNIILTLFYVAWLIAVLVFLWFIYRNGVETSRKLTQALIDSSWQSAKAARASAETALTLAQQPPTLT